MNALSDYKPSLGFGLLLKGAPKRGKTVLGTMFPNPWVADCDNNLSGAARYWKATNPAKEIRYDIINTDPKTGQPVEDKLRWNRLITLTEAACKDPWVKTIFWDSANTICTYLTDYIVSEKEGNKKEYMTIGDWIPFRNALAAAISKYRSYGKMFIMSSHEIADEDPTTGEVKWVANIPSNLRFHFGGFFSDEWLLDARTEIDKGTDRSLDRVVRFIKSSPEPARSLGSSVLGLPLVPWVFKWEEFEQLLNGKTKTV